MWRRRDVHSGTNVSGSPSVCICVCVYDFTKESVANSLTEGSASSVERPRF